MDRRSLLKMIPAIGAVPLASKGAAEPKSETLPPLILEMLCEGCGTRFQFHLGANAVCPKCFMTWWIDMQKLQRGDYDLRRR
jgi:hypothetical protein